MPATEPPKAMSILLGATQFTCSPWLSSHPLIESMSWPDRPNRVPISTGVSQW